jgi:hypothetical protein
VWAFKYFFASKSFKYFFEPENAYRKPLVILKTLAKAACVPEKP